ncbi:hypothetical protein [Acidimangrovimonas pyrenivorans]|uniref:N-acetylglucosaminyltransferase n=1 Tax=Acidimangrovimonas pyrenivorans TaxID=2030798 RepID=A0ABV7ANQ1_9RHOB
MTTTNPAPRSGPAGEKRQVLDVFLFFNELDLLELRLHCLNDVVDKFILTECTETFSGKAKPMHFAENRERFRAFEDKIVYNPVGPDELALLRGPEWRSWVTDLDRSLKHKHSGRPARELHRSVLREISHRDAAVLGLSRQARPGDLVLLSDVDEIPDPETVRAVAAKGVTQPSYFEMKWYLYWINNRVQQPWYGTVAFDYAMLEGQSLDMFRYGSSDTVGLPGPIIANGGWHFSYLGGGEAIAAKLEALAYQGLRARFSMLLNRLRRNGWQSVLDRNSDLLLQDRSLRLEPLDDSYPAALHELPGFVDTYARRTA